MKHDNMVPQILLWGGGSQSRLVAEMLAESNKGFISLIFDSALSMLKYESAAPFTNDPNELCKIIGDLTHFVVCIGAEHGFARTQIDKQLIGLGLSPLSILHHKSFVEPTSVHGHGCLIMPGAVVHKFCRLGNQCIVNTNATIDHECSIGNGVHVMGSAAIAGRVTVHDCATIGTNATILPDLVIGEGAYVGAGSVVTKDVDPYTVVSGVPARPTRKLAPVFDPKPLNELVRKQTAFNEHKNQ